ncbi:gliding motility-associated C-terminal domain-containing protein [Parapedobacter deserti]|uniref:Gliding motility-associated C-terminal domain-containing protein n=1 Tax=Parapedobacter deserti TaxID=1912957 RepID=A0ABV7JT93_9SPHI
MKTAALPLWVIFPFILAMQTGHGPSRNNFRSFLTDEATKLVPDDTSGATFFEDFSYRFPDGWHGDVPLFTTIDARLRLAERATGPASVSIGSERLHNTVWEIGIQVHGTLSASNYMRLYMTAGQGSPTAGQYGYHLQIDGTPAGHRYGLWRQHGHTRSLILQSAVIPSQQARFRARVRVVRDTDGYWQVLTDEHDTGTFTLITDVIGNSTVKDATYTIGQHVGYFVNFSPMRRQDFILDYLLIKPFDRNADSVKPDVPQPEEILINEVLSHPRPGGVDFVELYNNSAKTVDLRHISVAHVNSRGEAGPKRKVTDIPILFHPNEYKVLTINPNILKEHYPNGDFNTFVGVTAFPNFNNENGGVVLYYEDKMIDSLFYTPAMQSPFSSSHQGVSLERQHFSWPTLAPGNFRSAATSVGGATPGYRNSTNPVEPAEDAVFLTSKTFSPDNDGFEDQLEINYHFPAAGFVATVDIYNDKGLLVKRLQRNQRMAVHGTITWDGLSDANQRLPVGVYIAVIEAYNETGIQRIYRKSFVLAARL